MLREFRPETSPLYETLKVRFHTVPLTHHTEIDYDVTIVFSPPRQTPPVLEKQD